VSSEQNDAAREAIVGAWKLVEYHDRDTESDPWTPTFGTSPTGMLIYHPTGLLSAQVAASADDPDATFRYVGYFGTYIVREARQEGDAIVGIVEHHMESAYPDELLDEGPDRQFRIAGDQLTLGDGRTSRRLCRRVL
jgi:Lipocalin-like domain